MSDRVTRYECSCGLLHNTKAQALFCEDEGSHFKDLLAQSPVEEKDPYGKIIRSYVWERVTSEVGDVLARRDV